MSLSHQRNNDFPRDRALSSWIGRTDVKHYEKTWEKDDTARERKARTWATPGKSSATTDSAVRSDRSTSWWNCSKELQRPPSATSSRANRGSPSGSSWLRHRTCGMSHPRGLGQTQTRAELPSAGVGTGCSAVLAASASATSFP